MKLYHGTAASLIDSIVSEGIKPRGRRRGNWKQYPSRPDMVYLSTAYAPYFAMQASRKGDLRMLICEVESEGLEDSLYPDEDFIAQAVSHQKKIPIELCHGQIRRTIQRYQHHWRDSVAGLGNAAHKGVVPPSRITRTCAVDLSKHKEMLFVIDPSISVLNYKFCGEQYRSVTAWLFGDREDFLLGIAGNAPHIAMMEKIQPGYGEQVRELFSNRDGIEVVVR